MYKNISVAQTRAELELFKVDKSEFWMSGEIFFKYFHENEAFEVNDSIIAKLLRSEDYFRYCYCYVNVRKILGCMF